MFTMSGHNDEHVLYILRGAAIGGLQIDMLN